MGKHAYLITAHSHINQLIKLINCLDYPENDIYIHIDKKYKYLNEEEISQIAKQSRVIFIKRINVNWGGYSLVRARFGLLKEAYSNRPYDFYHYISGQDLPLKPQSYIHQFFDKHKNEEFISIEPYSEWYLDRVKYYYLRETKWSRSTLGVIINKVLLVAQKIIGLNRIRKEDIQFYVGEEWFSVTEQFVEYVLSMEDRCKKMFSHGNCTDELVFATLYMNSLHKNVRYISEFHSDYISKERMNIVRAIDWERGNPYIFRIDDYQWLQNSGCIFARKFDDTVDSEIINRICADVLK